MKNLHYLKKFVVMVLAAMMTLSTFAMPTFADGKAMTIKGVEYTEKEVNGKTVTTEVVGYQIVSKNDNNEWVPNTDYLEEVKQTVDGKEKVTGWKVKGTNIAYPMPSPTNTESPSGAALQALAKIAQTKTKTIDFTYVPADKNFVNTDDTKGSFLVLVKNNNSTETYNPMLVSRDDTATPASVTAAIGSGEAYAKKSEVPFEKVVDRRAPHNKNTNNPNGKVTDDGLEAGDNASATNADPAEGVDGNKGDTAGSKTTGSTKISYDPTTGFTTDGKTVYDDVWFRINTKVPDYAENYFSLNPKPQFIVYDTLSDGLTFNDVEGDGENLGMWVEVGNDTIYKTNADVVITKLPKSGNYDGKTFVVEFTEDGLKKYGGEFVEICYSAKLNTNHGVNFDAETNTASLEYTRNPGEAPQKGEDKITYHYTFTINGSVTANYEKENREVIKIGLDNDNNVVLEETVSKTKTGWKPLEGVKFNLYKKGTNDVVKEVITDADGILRGMEQIDAGEYELEETFIPEKYSEYKLKDTRIPVVIDADLDDKGRLEAYKVTVNGIVVGNYKMDYSTNKIQFLNQAGDKLVAEVDYKTGALNTDIGKVARHEFKVAETTWTDTDTEAADIINSKVGTLPSTGGMGTVLFTVGGAAIMALALFLLFGGKKKQHQK